MRAGESNIDTLAGGVRIGMEAPASEDFIASRPTVLIVYATPNGSTVEQTLGGKPDANGAALDPKFDLQHIGAQTRKLREVDRRENIVLAVVQAPQRSWPAFHKTHPDAPQLEHAILEEDIKRVGHPIDAVELTGHSGGGSFLFGYLDAADAIPPSVRRIAFLDANYSYADESHHGGKLLAWLRADTKHTLVVIAYDDREITLNGKKVVGPTGGTFRASHRMLDRFSKDLTFTQGVLGSFDTWTAMNGQVRFFIHPNPQNKILHTALVGDMNGFLQAMTVGTPDEGTWGTFGGPRAYTECIQPISPHSIPPRPEHAASGAAVMQQVADLPIAEREATIANEILGGNVPPFLRQFKPVRITSTLADGRSHTIELRVAPDYLAVGGDADFVRVPLTPMTAWRIADAFDCVLPTRRMADEVYRQADVKLDPHPMTENRESIATFVEHNRIIEEQRAGRSLGGVVAGIKKDVVLTNRLKDHPGHVAIYGWHKLDGTPIQPLTTIHREDYVDYSHGIRLIAKHVVLDGLDAEIQAVLTDPMLCALLSDEGPIEPSTWYRNPTTQAGSRPMH